METIQELSKRLDGLISSIKEEDIEDKEFITHKYMVISLHAHTERCTLEASMMTSSQKMAFKKQHHLYKSMETLLKKKAHESTAKEMYQRILECQKLVTDSASSNIT